MSDEYHEQAARIRALAGRDIAAICADRGLERDQKAAAVNACIDRARAELEQIATQAPSPAAVQARLGQLEAHAFGMPAGQAAAVVTVADDPDSALAQLSQATRVGDRALAVGIGAEAWCRCLEGRRGWVKVISAYAEQSLQPAAVRRLLAVLTPRDRHAELLAFTPGFPEQLNSQLLTVTASP
jgi:hypothetical protein